MKKNKIIKTAAVSAAMMLAAAGCSAEPVKESRKHDASVDLEYIAEAGTLRVGITEFAPLDYMDGSGEGGWMGFDAELAAKFAEKLGVSVEFVEIDWDEKVKLLDSGEIDLIWNGMTKTPELEKSISCSVPYLNNSQVIVMKSTELRKYKTSDDCKHLLFSYEKGSSAETLLKSKKYRTVECDSQAAAIEAVKNERSDAAVVDLIMAAYMTGEKSTQFRDLGFAYPLNQEDFCVGMRKGSPLEARVNEFFKEIAADGSLYTTADKYGLRSALAELL